MGRNPAGPLGGDETFSGGHDASGGDQTSRESYGRPYQVTLGAAVGENRISSYGNGTTGFTQETETENSSENLVKFYSAGIRQTL